MDEVLEQLATVDAALLASPDDANLLELRAQLDELRMALGGAPAPASAASSSSSSSSAAAAAAAAPSDDTSGDWEEYSSEDSDDMFTQSRKKKVRRKEAAHSAAATLAPSAAELASQQAAAAQEQAALELRLATSVCDADRVVVTTEWREAGMTTDESASVSPALPPPIIHFHQLVGCPPQLLTNIRAAGYLAPTPIQRYSLPLLGRRCNVLATAATGSGKTAAYLIPFVAHLMNNPSTARPHYYTMRPSLVVLAPTRELAIQIHAECVRLTAGSTLVAALAYGGVDRSEQERSLDISARIIVATPGRLVDFVESSKVALGDVHSLVLDEADRMLEQGFERDLRRLVSGSGMPSASARCTAMLSATFPKPVRAIAADFLQAYAFVQVGDRNAAATVVQQSIVRLDNSSVMAKAKAVAAEVRRVPGKTLVFVERKATAAELEQMLVARGIDAVSMHGGQTQAEREQALHAFKSGGSTRLLVATNVAARGLHVDDIAHVILAEMSADISAYIHRVGRTGRVGKQGHATALFGDRDRALAPKLVGVLRHSGQPVPEWLDRVAAEVRAGFVNEAPPPEIGPQVPMAADEAASGNDDAVAAAAAAADAAMVPTAVGAPVADEQHSESSDVDE